MQLKLVRKDQETALYSLVSKDTLNAYYVISSEGSRRLMASPEVIGYECCDVLKKPMTAALKALEPDLKKAAILTILRGGLNYPLEECCHSLGIRLDNINFLSCERVIENHIIKGLEIRYEKLHPEKDCTLLIGDILASGDTIRKCLKYTIEQFDRVDKGRVLAPERGNVGVLTAELPLDLAALERAVHFGELHTAVADQLLEQLLLAVADSEQPEFFHF